MISQNNLSKNIKVKLLFTNNMFLNMVIFKQLKVARDTVTLKKITQLLVKKDWKILKKIVKFIS